MEEGEIESSVFPPTEITTDEGLYTQDGLADPITVDSDMSVSSDDDFELIEEETATAVLDKKKELMKKLILVKLKQKSAIQDSSSESSDESDCDLLRNDSNSDDDCIIIEPEETNIVKKPFIRRNKNNINVVEDDLESSVAPFPAAKDSKTAEETFKILIEDEEDNQVVAAPVLQSSISLPPPKH